MIGPEPNEPGIEPEDAGEEDHLAAAHREEARLVQHQKLYDAKASQAVRRCNPEHSARAEGAPGCWIEQINPTEIHLTEVEIHRKRAAFHRKAARELRASVREACTGIPESFQKSNPLNRNRDILGVSPIEEGASKEIAGAVMIFRKRPELTAEVLQKLVDCKIAQSALRGYGLPTFEAKDRSPLAERGVRATVRPVKMGLAVEIRAEDEFGARAVLVRAQRLAAVE